MKDVIRVHLYLIDLSQLPTLNKKYVNYFKHPFPARTAVGIKELPLGASLEMDVMQQEINNHAFYGDYNEV